MPNHTSNEAFLKASEFFKRNPQSIEMEYEGFTYVRLQEKDSQSLYLRFKINQETQSGATGSVKGAELAIIKKHFLKTPSVKILDSNVLLKIQKIETPLDEAILKLESKVTRSLKSQQLFGLHPLTLELVIGNEVNSTFRNAYIILANHGKPITQSDIDALDDIQRLQATINALEEAQNFNNGSAFLTGEEHVHRDIKTDNYVINDKQYLTLIDYGEAMPRKEAILRTIEGCLLMRLSSNFNQLTYEKIKDSLEHKDAIILLNDQLVCVNKIEQTITPINSTHPLFNDLKNCIPETKKLADKKELDLIKKVTNGALKRNTVTPYQGTPGYLPIPTSFLQLPLCKPSDVTIRFAKNEGLENSPYEIIIDEVKDSLVFKTANREIELDISKEKLEKIKEQLKRRDNLQDEIEKRNLSRKLIKDDILNIETHIENLGSEQASEWERIEEDLIRREIIAAKRVAYMPKGMEQYGPSFYNEVTVEVLSKKAHNMLKTNTRAELHTKDSFDEIISILKQDLNTLLTQREYRPLRPLARAQFFHIPHETTTATSTSSKTTTSLPNINSQSPRLEKYSYIVDQVNNNPPSSDEVPVLKTRSRDGSVTHLPIIESKQLDNIIPASAPNFDDTGGRKLKRSVSLREVRFKEKVKEKPTSSELKNRSGSSTKLFINLAKLTTKNDPNPPSSPSRNRLPSPKNRLLSPGKSSKKDDKSHKDEGIGPRI